MMLIMEPRVLRVAWKEHEESHKPIMFDSVINSVRFVYAGHLKAAGARCLSTDHQHFFT